MGNFQLDWRQVTKMYPAVTMHSGDPHQVKDAQGAAGESTAVVEVRHHPRGSSPRL